MAIECVLNRDVDGVPKGTPVTLAACSNLLILDNTYPNCSVVLPGHIIAGGRGHSNQFVIDQEITPCSYSDDALIDRMGGHNIDCFWDVRLSALTVNRASFMASRENMTESFYNMALATFTFDVDDSVDLSSYMKCSHCDKSFEFLNNLVLVDNNWLCKDCVNKLLQEQKIFKCDGCGRYHFIKNLYKKNMCRDGFNRCFKKCNMCGKWIDYRKHRMHITPNGNFVCSHCYRPENSKYFIKRYHDTPNYKYYYDNGRVEDTNSNFKGFGVELEVDEGLKNSERMSRKTIEIMKDEVYCMRDGSVPEGFEIITMPHEENSLFNMPWKELFTSLKRRGYDSERLGRCGLHLHISTSLFKDDVAIQKMIYFYEKFKDDISKFSRRESKEISRWSSFYYSKKNVTFNDAVNVLDDYTSNYTGHDYRYRCVNLQPIKRTIEIRIMRGTIDYRDFTATLKFMIEIAKMSNEISMEDINDYTKWLKNVDQNCIRYMRKHDCFTKMYKRS